MKQAAAFEKYWRTGFALVLIVFFIIGIFAFQRLFVFAEANRWVEHSHEVSETLNLINLELKDLETSSNEFAAYGEKEYLEEATGAATTLSALLAQLQTLTADNREQNARAVRLKELAGKKIADFQAKLEKYNSAPDPAALEQTFKTSDKKINAEIDRTTTDFSLAEKSLLRERSTRAQEIKNVSYLVIGGTILGAMAMALFAYWLNRTFEKRNQQLKKEVENRETAQRAFEESERRFRVALQNAPILVYNTDREGRYTWVYSSNPNQDSERLIGKRDDELLPPEDVRPLVELKDRVLQTGVGERQTVEFPFRGRQEAYNITVEPIKDENNKVTGLTVAAINFTSLKESEKALRESEEKLKAITDTMPQIVWSTRADGYHDYFNERWYEYTGMPRTGDQGFNWKDYLHPDDFERAQKVWNRSLETGEIYEIEYRFRRAADGEYRWFIGRAVPIKDQDGNITRWFGTCTDVDDQYRMMKEREELLESERTARAEAERAVRQKDEFVATLSHELRAPLNAILGWTQIIKKSEPEDPTLQKGLTVIERNVRTQEQLISDLFDMNRIVAGKMRLDIGQVDISQVIENATESISHAAAAKNIQVQTLIDSSTVNILGDKERLQQVFWNLLSNAVKFTPKNGHINVLVKRVESHLQITVADDGEGIEPEFLAFMFDRYRQADGTTTRKHGGLGIGLSIVKNIIELHGGRIAVASEGKGKGTTFIVRLPIASALRTMFDGTDVLQSDVVFEERLTDVSILVVDDEADSRELVERILTQYNARVILAGSVDEAIEKFKREKPHIIISDIGMPEKDGFQFIRELRRLENGRRTPAIALTAFARSEDRTRIMREGFQAHVTKPVEAAELIATLISFVKLNSEIEA